MKCLTAITCLLALSASAKGDGSYGTEVYAPGHASLDYYAYPSYAFEYAVRDPKTGDNKAQWEKRDGDVVIGAYSLVEPDGSIRVVEYRADDKSGFNAVVKRIGPNLHPVTVPIYKAPLPVIGYKSEVPISIGPVAGIEKLAGAPLLKGLYDGGLKGLYGGGLKGLYDGGVGVSSASLYKPSTPVYVKEVLPAPYINEPIVPIIKEPIVPYPIVKEPYLPIYKQPIYPAPYLKEPIVPIPVLKEAIYKPYYPEPYLGPIVKKPVLAAPIYKSPVLANPLYSGEYNLPLLLKGILEEKGLELYGKGLGLYEKGLGPYEKGLGPYDKGLGYYDKGLGLYDKGLGYYDKGLYDYKGYGNIGYGH